MPTLYDLLDDRNGDGVLDDLAGRIVLDLPDGRAPRDFWASLFDLVACLGVHAGALPFPVALPAAGASEIPDGVQQLWVRSLEDLQAIGFPEPHDQGSDSEPVQSEPSGSAPCLSRLFSPDGMLADLDGDLLPDASAVGFNLPEDMGSELGAALANLAARIGLESGGVTLPLVSEQGRQFVVRPDDDDPELTPYESGWLARGRDAELARLIDLVASTWPHITIPEAGGVRSGVDRLARALAGHRESGTQPGEMLWELQWSAEWEVPRLIDAFRDRVLRRLDPAVPLRITAFVSEPYAIRQRLARTLRHEAERYGLQVDDVRVFNAFKAGLSWMREEVIPAAKDLGTSTLQIEYQRFEGPSGGFPSLDLPIRWLQELFPVDEIAADALSVPVESIQFTETSDDGPTYTAIARDSSGEDIGRWTCDLLSVERPFVTRFPDEGTVRVTTGGLIVEQGDERYVERVETDLERFWNFWQREVLPRVIRQAESAGVTVSAQPFFGRLDVEVNISEPNAPLGVREENDSAAEALHEDIYFNTLDTLEILGLRTSGEKTSAPGAVVPVVRVAPNMPPHARVRLFATPERPSRRIPNAAIVALRMHGDQLLPVIDIRATDVTSNDVLAAGQSLIQGAATLPAIVRSGAEETPVDIPLPFELAAESEPEHAPPLDELINGERTLEIAASLAAHSEVTAWIEGRSFEDRPIPALALRSPTPGRLAPPAKAAILKPTALIVARHHANEISSTNAALQLAHLCSTEPEWVGILDRLNVVILPFENADGAALHERLASDPDAATWKHHPARYNALGFEFSEDFHNPVTRFGESRVRPAIWRRWLPDVIVDNHGVPSHEWVQPFAGFGSPPRFRVPYWIPQALIYGIVGSVDDERYPEHRQASDALVGAVSRAIGASDLAEWNAIYYRSYRVWAQSREPERFPGELREGMLWHLSTMPAGADQRSFAARYPRTTVLNWVTEVNDETAAGEHLERVARAHLLANRAMLDLMGRSAPEIEPSLVVDEDGRRTYRFSRRRPLRMGVD